MFDRAGRLLADNRSVILDACFLAERERQRAREIAEETGSRFTIIAVTAPDEVVKKRISQRMKKKSVSDATIEVYLKQKLVCQPLTAANRPMPSAWIRPTTNGTTCARPSVGCCWADSGM